MTAVQGRTSAGERKQTTKVTKPVRRCWQNKACITQIMNWGCRGSYNAAASGTAAPKPVRWSVLHAQFRFAHAGYTRHSRCVRVAVACCTSLALARRTQAQTRLLLLLRRRQQRPAGGSEGSSVKHAHSHRNNNLCHTSTHQRESRRPQARAGHQRVCVRHAVTKRRTPE